MSPNSEICHVFNFMNTTSITRVFSSFAPFGDGGLNALEPKRADQLTDGQMTRYFLNLLAPSFLLLPITKKSKANTLFTSKKITKQKIPKNRFKNFNEENNRCNGSFDGSFRDSHSPSSAPSKSQISSSFSEA